VSLLSRVEVSELRLWWTADPPRPFQLCPAPQLSAPGLRSRDFYSRLIYRRLSVFRFHRVAPVSSSVSGTCVLSTLRLFRLAPFEFRICRCLSSLRPRSSRAWALPTLQTLLQCYLFLVFSTWWGLRLLASISRDRVSLSSHPSVVRPAFAEPGPGDVFSTTWTLYPLSVTLHCLSTGRPSGRWVSS